MTYFRLFVHRSRHCLPLRPGTWRASSGQRLGPHCPMISINFVSSSISHKPVRVIPEFNIPYQSNIGPCDTGRMCMLSCESLSGMHVSTHERGGCAFAAVPRTYVFALGRRPLSFRLGMIDFAHGLLLGVRRRTSSLWHIISPRWAVFGAGQPSVP